MSQCVIEYDKGRCNVCRFDCTGFLWVRDDIVQNVVTESCLILRYCYFIFNDGMQKDSREIDDLIISDHQSRNVRNH